MNGSNRLIGIIILYLVTAFICIGFLVGRGMVEYKAAMHYGKAAILERKGEIEEARHYYAQAAKLQYWNWTYYIKSRIYQDPQPLLNHFEDLIEQGKQAEAISYAQERIKELQDSECPIERYVARGFHKRLVRIYEKEGQKDLSQEHEAAAQRLKAEVKRHVKLYGILAGFPLDFSGWSTVYTVLLSMILGMALGIIGIGKKRRELLSIDSRLRPKEIVSILILYILPYFFFVTLIRRVDYGMGKILGLTLLPWLIIVTSLVHFLRRRKGKGVIALVKELFFLCMIIFPFWLVVFMFYWSIGVPIIYSWLKY